MTPPRRKTTQSAAEKTIEERVAALEKLGRKLDRTTTALKKAHGETSARIEHIEQTIAEMPDAVAQRLTAAIQQATDSQTSELRVEIAQSETRQADRVTDVARQWPAAAIVLGTLAGGLVVDLLLAAFHLPHLQ